MTTHHIRVVRRSDSLVVKVVPVDRREKGVVLYFQLSIKRKKTALLSKNSHIQYNM